MKKISIFLITLSLLFAASCDNDFEQVNTDPNNPVKVPANLLLGALIRNSQNIYAGGIGSDMSSIWAQHWSKVEYNNEERYTPRQAVIDGHWTISYTNIVYDAKVMQQLAVEEGNTNLQAISLIMQANTFQVLTDLYGPIPFSEAGIKGNLKPKFDSQEDVYSGIIAMLTQADALLANGTGAVPSTSDLIYLGDTSKWKKLANSLKLKALIRIAKAPGVNNAAEIATLIASGKLMTSNSDNALILNKPVVADGNPMYRTLDGRGEFKVSSVLVTKCQTLNDPRLANFAKPVGTIYVGNVPGQETKNYAGTSAVGAFYNKPELPSVIMSYSQVEFLLAEAANEGYIANPDVATDVSVSLDHLRKGIAASFAYNGLTSSQASAYFSQPNLIYTGADRIGARKTIGEQVWFSLYYQGVEAFTEWRRTGFPVLAPAFLGVISEIPSRFFYPTSENQLNSANYASAVATLANGDELTSKLWWDVN
ncbi:SusD/RagB family nutrient-binding outer membrane lipoprotein [Flavobacterium sp.]|uniref:SusD/RagB family nutrient-binding outer membrane lipoprotein n=1 Tax=Flavobacterium sp. TaxID=239 RepID=UPI00286DFE6D|nr:SusD/RagB family nutrient-binding outer membrane lipoprotein [Flavobacterium sp.]